MNHKIGFTTAWKRILILLTTLIMFLILWLLVGEMDLLNVDWLVGHNGVLWKGNCQSDATQLWVWDRYSHYLLMVPGVTGFASFQAWLNTNGFNITITNTQGLIFNPLLLIPMFGIVLFAFTVPIILRLFKWCNYDVLPFNITLAISLFIFMICGLIPSFGSYNTFRWVLIVFITLVSLLTFFLISNRIVNNILDNTTDSSILVNDINSKNRENAPYRKSLDDLVKDYKKRDNIDHVDIEK